MTAKKEQNRSPITPRKKPFQQRSQKRVADILNAAITLLEDIGIEGITTHHIAKQAGIPVASVYQYFPNKQAVIYAVFEKWLSWVNKKFDEGEENYYLALPWEAFFDHLLMAVLKKTLFSYKAENQLSRAMRTSPELIELDRQHGDAIAGRLAGYLKGYGSDWPPERLNKLGHLLYQMSSVLYYQFGDEKVIERKLLLEWSRTMVHTLIGKCLNPDRS